MKQFKRKLKKAFTITELVIVIAVIAILAAVLIPTFTYVVKRANQSSAMQAAKSASTNYYAYALGESSSADINGFYFVSGEYAFEFKNNAFDSTALNKDETVTGLTKVSVPEELWADFNLDDDDKTNDIEIYMPESVSLTIKDSANEELEQNEKGEYTLSATLATGTTTTTIGTIEVKGTVTVESNSDDITATESNTTYTIATESTTAVNGVVTVLYNGVPVATINVTVTTSGS